MSARRLDIILKPQVLKWARERAGLEADQLATKIKVKSKRVDFWENSGKITIVQAEKLARCTHTPLGYLFLSEPPEEHLPIPDFRTFGDQPPRRPSPNLIETVYTMQRRQDWLRDEVIDKGIEPLEFVAGYSRETDPEIVANAIRSTLGLEQDWAAHLSSWDNALRFLRQRIDDVGILLFLNGVVGNNSHRKLDLEEFRGFVLVDNYAPLIFINNNDFKAPKIFTLVHELAHLFVGESGVSNPEEFVEPQNVTEQFCNSIAAEFLVPAGHITNLWNQYSDENEAFDKFARRYKVSRLVIARRALDLGMINQSAFYRFLEVSQRDVSISQQPSSSGGDFWRTQNVRIGRRFGSEVVRALRDGRLLYRHAYELTGLRGKTFDTFIEQMEESE